MINEVKDFSGRTQEQLKAAYEIWRFNYGKSGTLSDRLVRENTKVELLAMAAELGTEVNARMKKSELAYVLSDEIYEMRSIFMNSPKEEESEMTETDAECLTVEQLEQEVTRADKDLSEMFNLMDKINNKPRHEHQAIFDVQDTFFTKGLYSAKDAEQVFYYAASHLAYLSRLNENERREFMCQFNKAKILKIYASALTNEKSVLTTKAGCVEFILEVLRQYDTYKAAKTETVIEPEVEAELLTLEQLEQETGFTYCHRLGQEFLPGELSLDQISDQIESLEWLMNYGDNKGSIYGLAYAFGISLEDKSCEELLSEIKEFIKSFLYEAKTPSQSELFSLSSNNKCLTATYKGYQWVLEHDKATIERCQTPEEIQAKLLTVDKGSMVGIAHACGMTDPIRNYKKLNKNELAEICTQKIFEARTISEVI